MGAKKVIIRVWSAVLLVFYVAVLALGIMCLIFLKVVPEIGIILIILSVLGFLVGICGCVGARYHKKEDWDGQKGTGLFLIVFFAVMIFFHVVFLIFGGVLIFLAKSFKLLSILPGGRFLNSLDTLPDFFVGDAESVAGKIINVVPKIKNFLVAIGIVLIVIAVFHLATVIITAFRMGKTLFTKFFIGVCSIIDVAIGLTLGILLLVISFSKSSMFYKQFPTIVVVPLVIFGFVLAVVGGAGLLTAIMGVRHKAFTVIFNIGNIIVLAGFFAMFVVGLVFFRMAVPLAKGFCEDDSCKEWIENANEYNCDSGNDCYDETHLTKDFEVLFKALAGILIFVCLYLVFFVAVIVVSTMYLCLKKDKEGYSNA